ncbi:hypothetical protein ACIRNI_05045 [Streptomyces sp. NPDC093546]|uniref:hypothetical protein n=1 Tax=Streptomyces sp. NPDC093546 TaxID=3366040 RepID=UPI0038099C2A
MLFTGDTARLVLGNGGDSPLELTVEPWAEVHLIEPGQSRVVVTHSPSGDRSWSGTLRGDEPFRVDHRPDAVTVWANGHCFHLTDAEGTALDAEASHCPAQGLTS